VPKALGAPGDRVRILHYLTESGAAPLIDVAQAATTSPDGIAAVLTLVCQDLLEIDLVQASLAPETLVRRRIAYREGVSCAFAIMSDLHLEIRARPVRGDEWSAFVERRANILWHPRVGPLLDEAVGVDLLILAGDIDVGTRAIAYANEAAES